MYVLRFIKVAAVANAVLMCHKVKAGFAYYVFRRTQTETRFTPLHCTDSEEIIINPGNSLFLLSEAQKASGLKGTLMLHSIS